MSRLQMTDEEKAIPYFGSRGKDFEDLIFSILKRANIEERFYVKSHPDFSNDSNLLGDMDLWGQIFTHKSIDPDINYEWYEFKGDLVGNLCVVEYIEDRFKHIQGTPSGVRVGTRLKINMVSKDTYEQIGKILHFEKFISATMEYKSTKMKALLEDVWEAVLGCICHLVDTKLRQKESNGRRFLGAGLQTCYFLVCSVLDEMPICGSLPAANGHQSDPLSYNMLVDAKTRLKELFDLADVQTQFGSVKYKNERIEETCFVTVFAVKNGDWIPLGKGNGRLQAQAQQLAAEHALSRMNKAGYKRTMPVGYSQYCK